MLGAHHAAFRMKSHLLRMKPHKVLCASSSNGAAAGSETNVDSITLLRTPSPWNLLQCQWSPNDSPPRSHRLILPSQLRKVHPFHANFMLKVAVSKETHAPHLIRFQVMSFNQHSPLPPPLRYLPRGLGFSYAGMYS